MLVVLLIEWMHLKDVYVLKPDLITITESWSGEDISDAEISIDDFAIFCSNGKISVGGGRILYLRNCYNATLVEYLTNAADTEAVRCKLILSNM